MVDGVEVRVIGFGFLKMVGSQNIFERLVKQPRLGKLTYVMFFTFCYVPFCKFNCLFCKLTLCLDFRLKEQSARSG